MKTSQQMPKNESTKSGMNRTTKAEKRVNSIYIVYNIYSYLFTTFIDNVRKLAIGRSAAIPAVKVKHSENQIVS